MQITCLECSRIVDYSGERPLFCGFCGKPISAAHAERTTEYAPDASSPTARLASATVTRAMPTAIGGFRLIKELGAGGMGTVYEAEDTISGRHVAVKLLAATFADSQETVERFRQEGRLASTIAHPRCVFVLAADEEAGCPYIVMELMSGLTLKDLVEKEGPLPEERAVTLILDVIDGLQEAHQNGVIHRDVKPSNCFLQADGRVKVGDFGLSKSLSGDAHLTRTGAFLGTPLFASPEQVRGELVDHQTDVYSVSATLYYLLTGRAPFQSTDAAITLARLASDPAPPMRRTRPALSAALDRVVMRGLERQRERRWRNLEALRTALMPFIPSRLSIGAMGIRLAAYLLDFALLAPLTWILIFLTFRWTGLNPDADNLNTFMLTELTPIAGTLVYYALLEGIWGCSLGKRWLGLRVCGLDGWASPGLARGFLRALLWNACLNGPYLLLAFDRNLADKPIMVLLAPLAVVAGILVVVSTMRARTGYRGPHELLSGTRVIQLPWTKKRRVYLGRPADSAPSKVSSLPAQVGPFTVRGVLCDGPESRLLTAEDVILGRKVWLWLRPFSAPRFPPARRDCARATRLRWLNGGQHEAWQWDAFLAPAGTFASHLHMKSGRLSWAEARPLLEQLAEELTAAGADRTLPATMTVNQVWVEPSGRLQLLDMPFGIGQTPSSEPPQTPGSCRDSASLAVLAQLAIMLLEGRSRGLDALPGPVRAPIPLHAAQCLHRLTGAGEPYHDVKEFQADLAATHDQPTEITRSRRAAHVGILALLLVLVFLCWIVALVIPVIGAVEELALAAEQGKNALDRMRVGAARDMAAGLVNRAPAARLNAAAQWQADKTLEKRVQDKLARTRAELAARRARLSWMVRRTLSSTKVGEQSHIDFRHQADSFLKRDVSRDQPFIMAIVLGLLLAGPLAWTAWALVARGGFSHGIVGMALVRTDGRRPGRLRCAWRALLFWIPPVVLMGAVVFFEVQSSVTWGPSAGATRPLIALFIWWASIVVWPLYAILALISPARSLHDRLAGTCLVPK